MGFTGTVQELHAIGLQRSGVDILYMQGLCKEITERLNQQQLTDMKTSNH